MNENYEPGKHLDFLKQSADIYKNTAEALLKMAEHHERYADDHLESEEDNRAAADQYYNRFFGAKSVPAVVSKYLEEADYDQEVAYASLLEAGETRHNAKIYLANAHHRTREVRWGLPDMGETGVDIPDLSTKRGRRLAAREILMELADRIGPEE